MEIVGLNQSNIVSVNTVLYRALYDFVTELKQCELLKGILISEKKTGKFRKQLVVSVVHAGETFDDILLESCKTIFETFAKLVCVDVSVNVVKEDDLTGLQSDSLSKNRIEDDKIVYDDDSSLKSFYEEVKDDATINQNGCHNDIGGRQYVKKR